MFPIVVQSAWACFRVYFNSPKPWRVLIPSFSFLSFFLLSFFPQLPYLHVVVPSALDNEPLHVVQVSEAGQLQQPGDAQRLVNLGHLKRYKRDYQFLMSNIGSAIIIDQKIIKEPSGSQYHSHKSVKEYLHDLYCSRKNVK